MKKILFYFIVSVSFFSCKTKETKSAFDLVNAKKEIEAAEKNICELMAKGDSIGSANCYSKDAKMMFNNHPAISGKSNITSVFSKWAKCYLHEKTLEVWGDENFITEEGEFETQTIDGKILDKGKALVIWKKEDGVWKLHRDMPSSDLPVVTK